MSIEPLQPIIITTRSVRSRPPKRKKKIGPALWKFGGVVVSCLAVSGLYQFTFSPYVMLSRQKKETKRLEQEVSEAKKNKAFLERRIQRLKSGEELVVEARRLGFIKPGEVSLSFISPVARK